MDMVQALLAGGRGRRLVYNFLLDCDELSGADREAAESPRLELHFRAMQLEAETASWAESLPAVDLSLENAAQWLRTMPLAPATRETVRRALAQSVDAARSWQAPEGVDLLLRQEPLRSSLLPAARHLVASGILQQLNRPADPAAQWAVLWDAQGQVRSSEEGGRESREILARWARRTTDFERDYQSNLVADLDSCVLGPWWSIPPQDLVHGTGIFDDGAPLGLWCEEDSLGWEQARVQPFAVSANSPVYEIDSADTWVALCRDYPMEVSATMRGSWTQATGRDGSWVQPDWQLVARDFAGVHLTPAAYLSCSGELIDVDPERSSLIAGWVPDATYWFSGGVQLRGPVQQWILEDGPRGHSDWALAIR